MLRLLDLTGRAAREEAESRTPLFIEFLLRQSKDTKHVLGALLWAFSDPVQSSPETDQEDRFSDLAVGGMAVVAHKCRRLCLNR